MIGSYIKLYLNAYAVNYYMLAVSPKLFFKGKVATRESTAVSYSYLSAPVVVWNVKDSTHYVVH